MPDGNRTKNGKTNKLSEWTQSEIRAGLLQFVDLPYLSAISPPAPAKRVSSVVTPLRAINPPSPRAPNLHEEYYAIGETNSPQ